MFRRFVMLVGVMATFTVAYSQTIVPGGDVYGVLDAAGSPYLIEGEIVTPSVDSHRVQPGIDVIFQGHFKLIVNGWLLAKGTETVPILFTASDTSGGVAWDPISVLSGFLLHRVLYLEKWVGDRKRGRCPGWCYILLLFQSQDQSFEHSIQFGHIRRWDFIRILQSPHCREVQLYIKNSSLKVTEKELVMSVKKLKQYLDSQKIMYTILAHSPAYTAQEIASLAHIKEEELAKTVIVKIDGKVTMAVLPASYRVDLDSLKEAVGAEIVELATEEEFSDLFPGCETGAMPPFGNLYDMDVLVALSLTEDDNIAFNACSHSELMQLSYNDFERLVKPKVIKFSVKREN